ncbi:MAG: hypothetical protein ABI685_10165 [Ferruginibacter sp.]
MAALSHQVVVIANLLVIPADLLEQVVAVILIGLIQYAAVALRGLRIISNAMLGINL